MRFYCIFNFILEIRELKLLYGILSNKNWVKKCDTQNLLSNTALYTSEWKSSVAMNMFFYNSVYFE